MIKLRLVIRTIATLMISVLMVLLFLKFLRESNTFQVVSRLTVYQVLCALLPVACLFISRSARFALLGGRKFKDQLFSAISATFQAYALNSILPFKLGELWRVAKLRSMREKSLLDAIGYSIFDRIFDVLFCILFMLPGAIIHIRELKSISIPKWLSLHSIGLFVLCILIFITVIGKSKFLKVAKKYLGIAISMKGTFWAMLAFSSVVWFFEYVVCLSAARLLDINISGVDLCFIIGFSNLLAAFIPSPGGIGAFEGAVIWCLMMFNQQTYANASTYAILVHGLLIVPVTIIGLTWVVIDVVNKQKNTKFF